MSEKTEKKKNKANPYTINFTQKEREEYESFAKKNGYPTFAKFIRESLDSVIENPSILFVEKKEQKISLFPEDIKQIAKELKKSDKKWVSGYPDHEPPELIPKHSRTAQHLVTIRYLDLIARKVGATKQEIKQVNKRDQAAVAVFERRPS